MAKVSPEEFNNENLQGDFVSPRAAPKKKKTTTQKFMKFLFSELGLVLIIIIYTIAGGFLFRAIEFPNEKDEKEKVRQAALHIEDRRKRLHSDILELTDYYLFIRMNRTETVREYKMLLDEYHAIVAEAIGNGYDGTVHKQEDDHYGWDVLSSILFCATILTTIGYGHVFPTTEVGQLVCIIYSTIAVPLMSIFLMKIGKAITALLRIMYNKICCMWCGNKRIRYRKEDRIKCLADKKARERNGDQVTEFNTQNNYFSPDLDVDLGVDVKDDNYVPDDKLWRDDYDATPPVTMVIFMVILYIFSGTVIFTLSEGWSLVNSLYCCFVSLLVIGFGDYVPGNSKADKGFWRGIKLAFTTFYIVVGVAVLAMFIDIVVEALTKDYSEDDDDDDDDTDFNDKDDIGSDKNGNPENGDYPRNMEGQPDNLYSDTTADVPPPVAAAP